MALAPSSGVKVADEPLFVVDADKISIGLSPKDLWAHRELLYFLTWRDVGPATTAVAHADLLFRIRAVGGRQV